MTKRRKQNWPVYGTALAVLTLATSAFRPAEGEHLSADLPLSLALDDEPRFKVNFPDVSILEFVKFISKIGDINFVYNQDELNFNISIVSEEDTSLSNVMAILVQVLRINGYSILEQDGNLVIHKNPAIVEIPTVISSEVPLEGNHLPPLITRVFSIRNGNPTGIATILKPMLSPGAVLEVSTETRHLIVADVSTNIEKIANLLRSLDAPQASLDMESFRAKHSSAEALTLLATQILTPIAEGNPLIFVPQLDSNSIYIVSTPFLIEKALATLEDLDTLPGFNSMEHMTADNILLYKVKAKPVAILMEALRAIDEDMSSQGYPTTGLSSVLKSMRPLSRTQTILFVGSSGVLQEINKILSDLDTPTATGANDETFYIYKIQSSTGQQIRSSITNLIETLKKSEAPSQDLISALESMEWNHGTNSLIFTGDPNALNQVKEILPSFDVSPSRSKLASSEFFMYAPHFYAGPDLIKRLEDIEDSLVKAHLADPALLYTLKTARWLPESNSILFTGDKDSLDRVKELLSEIDGDTGFDGQLTLFVYKIQHIGQRKLDQGLKHIADTLPATDPLHRVVNSMRYIPESNSIAFRGTQGVIARLKEVLASIDSADQADRLDNFYLFQPERTSAPDLITGLSNIAKDLDPSVGDNESLIESIHHVKVIPSTNSLLVTGRPYAIAKVKTLLTELDQAGAGTGMASNFFLYKPQYMNALDLKKSLDVLADDLVDSGLSDPAVIRTIQSARTIEQTNSILFTGTPESIASAKELLAEVDSPSHGAKQVGESTFLIYKIKYANPKALMKALGNISNDLSKAGGGNQAIATTLKGMRYISETNSLIFTGTAKTLEKANGLAQRFDTKELSIDISETPRMTPEDYFIYHPKSKSGPELITILQDFEDHLSQSGVQEKALYDTIHNLKFMDKTNSILISGNKQATEKTMLLLERFDVPGTADTDFGKIDEMSFLIYKLQYHRGPEIESALRQMGDDLRRLKDADKHERLINAIDSAQWLEVTNSILSTGNEQTLAKLKELIKSVDVPLRQVFIEVLVLETSLSHSLDFGLRWGSQGQYKNKLGFGTGSFPNLATDEDPLSAFNTNLAGINSTTTPTGQNIPVGSTGGWDLGVIGDVILHKGLSYLALGSLVNALQVDGDSTVVLNQKILTQDNKNSNLFVGQNIPFTGSTLKVSGGASNSASANLEYRDIGVSLSITPILGDDDIITMDIDQEISEVEGIPGQSFVSTSDVTGITTSKSSTQTTVSMPNKHFLVLSGQLRNDVTRSKTSVPCLGGLPIIGAAFSQNEKLDNKRNIIVFLRPHIVNSFEEYKEITQRQEDIYRSQAQQEDFDAGLELVKTPDDE